MASHQLTKFGGHGHFRSREKMILDCRVISQEHVIKGTFVTLTQSKFYDTAKFRGHMHCGGGNMILVYM